MKSLVIPVYRNEETLLSLLECLEQINADLSGDLEAVFVVDGSPDRSHELLRERLPKSSFSAQLVRLSRNFGSFESIRLGLEVSQGAQYAVLSADLQEPPELITEFFRLLDQEDVDILVGRRTGRDDPLVSRWASSLFWWCTESWHRAR